LILDTPSVEDDERLAQHIAYVHIHEEHPPMDFEPLKAEDIRYYPLGIVNIEITLQQQDKSDPMSRRM
jgi:DNA replicative helicase MCM subunit Mcm2 (Cdc46/Mcm family)